MNEPERAEADPPPDEVDAVLQEFGGDHRAAIRALLHDLDVLARGYDQTVSKGYVRGKLRPVSEMR